MKRSLITIVKYFKFLYKVYYWIGSLFINIMKKIISTDEKLILFISYGGKKYDDSPRAIYESLIEDVRFQNYDLVWAFQEPDKFKIKKGRKIKADTLEYFITALKARCWITNSAVERGLDFKGKKTFYLNTWHGTPIKKMGVDMSSKSTSFRMVKKWDVDLMTSQSNYESDILSKVLNIDRDNFLICGLPRNDILIDNSIETKVSMMEKIGLPLDKKVILYAPTFREFNRDETLNCVISPPINFEKWKESIGEEFIVLLRAHYEVTRIMNIEEDNGFIYNVSDYPVLNELMLASDMLISDYSSIFFDYSILEKPMICFTYDYDEYEDKRGMYFDIRDELTGGSIGEDELLGLIENLDIDSEKKKVRQFRAKYVESYGSATNIAIDNIFKSIHNN